jgi:hypothetical protein
MRPFLTEPAFDDQVARVIFFSAPHTEQKGGGDYNILTKEYS